MFEVSCIKIKTIFFRVKDEKILEENTAKNIERKEINEKDIKAKEFKETEEINIQKIEANENIWQIEIPKINLVAPIEEGTSIEVMNKFVGHFESTSKWNGNIGLAAHNRRISC